MNATPAKAVSPHCLRSIFKGVNSLSAPQCAAQAANPNTTTQSQIFIFIIDLFFSISRFT
jgi:hypothetical protein